MEDHTFHSGTQHLHAPVSGKKDGNITLAISEKFIELKDNQTGSLDNYPNSHCSKICLETGRNNDIIHISTNGDLHYPVDIDIETTGGHKLIVGSSDPMLQVNISKLHNGDLYLPDDETGTYECFAEQIKKWNEQNRIKDGWFKSIKRKIVYLFGRDLRFKRPFLIEKILKNFLSRCRLIHSANTPGVSYFTTRRHLDQLENIALPGDILLRYQEGYPLDKYLVGTWQHAGLYVRNGLVIDAMGNGTYLRTIDEFGEADGIVLIRIRNLTGRQVNLALSYAFEQIGKSYSVDFDDQCTEQYCSGLIVNAYKYAGVLHRDYLKNTSIHPDHLLKIHGAEILWTNRPSLLPT